MKKVYLILLMSSLGCTKKKIPFNYDARLVECGPNQLSSDHGCYEVDTVNLVKGTEVIPCYGPKEACKLADILTQ